MDDPQRTERPSLADKINQAFATLHPADRGPFSNKEVAQWFVKNGQPGEPTISVNYLAMLRSGERDNPTVRHLRALARFFEVPAEYFLEDSDDSAAVHDDLKMVAAMRDADVREIAARAMELDPSMRQWLRDTVAGLPAASTSARRRRRFQAPPPGETSGPWETEAD
jgi:transcriptional regulator with XRE-family HTH domain